MLPQINFVIPLSYYEIQCNVKENHVITRYHNNCLSKWRALLTTLVCLFSIPAYNISYIACNLCSWADRLYPKNGLSRWMSRCCHKLIIHSPLAGCVVHKPLEELVSEFSTLLAHRVEDSKLTYTLTMWTWLYLYSTRSICWRTNWTPRLASRRAQVHNTTVEYLVWRLTR